MYVLGIHGSFGRAEHDSSAVLIKDNVILAAAEEERFVRYKHAVGLMPDHAIQFCLDFAGISMDEVDFIAFPRASWTDFPPRLNAYLWYKFGAVPEVIYVDHHTAHAASAYFISGFPTSLVLTLDQAGDGKSCAVFRGVDGKLELVKTTAFPRSLGLFAGFITQYLGFKSNHDEYKVMGLASYGKANIDLSHIIGIKDGEPYFDKDVLHDEALKRHPVFHTDQLPMFKNKVHAHLPSRRLPGGEILQSHKDLAASAQRAIEVVVLAYVKSYVNDDEYLCMSGGVAENSVAMGKIASENIFKDIYVGPASGDAGTALGAALYVAAQKGAVFSRLNDNKLGPEYSNEYAKELLDRLRLKYDVSDDVADDVSGLLVQQNIVAWFQGRMEFGPRALGARSLIADPSNEAMRARVNSIKRREQFRPFAPSVLEEHASELFKVEQRSPFMSFTLPVSEEGRGKITAAMHVDFTGRLQTVSKDGSAYRRLIESFYAKTGIPAILNTSLNSGWEPIVESPEQAIAFFFSSEADVLVIGNCIVKKDAQQ